MQNLKVTLMQAHQEWEDKKANLAHFDEMLDQIKAPTDIVLFPEMFHTGFSMNPEKLAESMDGEAVTWIKSKAKTHNCGIGASVIIKEDEKYFNRFTFAFPDGTIAHYDKRKLFGLAEEDKHYTPGKENTIIEYKGWKILLQVCYDLRFPEVCRNKVVNSNYDYDIMINVANWPEKRKNHWKSLLQARAIENQAYVVAVNRVGEGNKLNYSGDSCIISPLGDIEQHEAYDEIIINDELEYETLSEVRKKMPFLKDQ